MPNGKPGDHPYTDIVVHRRSVYSPRVDDLVRRVAMLSTQAERHQLADMLFRDFDDFNQPDVATLEAHLTSLHDQLVARAKERGWQVP